MSCTRPGATGSGRMCRRAPPGPPSQATSSWAERGCCRMPGAVTDTSYDPGGARTGTTAEFDGTDASLGPACAPSTAAAACLAPSEEMTISCGPPDTGRSAYTAPDTSTRPAAPLPSPSPGPARLAPPTTSTVLSEPARYAAAAMNDLPSGPAPASAPPGPAATAGGMTSNTTMLGLSAVAAPRRPTPPSCAPVPGAPAGGGQPGAPPTTVPLPPTMPRWPYADGPTTNQSVALPWPGTAIVSEAVPAAPVRNVPSHGHPSTRTRADRPSAPPGCAAGAPPPALAIRGSDVCTAAASGAPGAGAPASAAAPGPSSHAM